MSKKLKSQTKRKLSHDDEDDEEEEEEEEEGDYENDSFIDDGEVVDDESDDEQDNASNDNEVKDESFDESDYDVLEERKKKHKKLKKKLKQEGKKQDDDDFNFDDEEEVEGVQKNRNIKLEKSQFQYYGDEEEEKKKKKKKKKTEFSKNSNLYKIFNHDMDNEEDENEERNREITKEEKLKQINKFYSKDEIEDNFFTERDNLIQQIDFPERYLRRFNELELKKLVEDIQNEKENHILFTPEEEIIAETEFIFEKLRGISHQNFDSNSVKIKEKIRMVLEDMKSHYDETPLIVTYRKFHFDPELSNNDVWRIQCMDLEWKKMTTYKKSLKTQLKILKYLNIENIDYVENKFVDRAKNFQELKYMEAFITYYKEIYSEEIAKINEDGYIKSQLNNPKLENFIKQDEIKNEDDVEELMNNMIKSEESKPKHKRPVKKIVIPNHSRINSINLGRKFAITPYALYCNIEAFRSNQMDSNKIILPNDPEENPYDLSGRYLDDYFTKNYELMKSTCSFLANEILVYPPVKNYIFQVLKSYARLSTLPTTQGQKELDVFHQSFRVKRLKNKPISSFNNDIFLEILRCEKEGLITYSIDIETEDVKSLTDKLNKCYFKRHGHLDITKKWNVVREEIIKELMKQIVPQFKKEIIEYLKENAENYIVEESALSFRDFLMTPPFKK